MQTLQLQLTPHLLYNSLNTIRWMAQINGQENIKRITLALSKYLRSLSDIESEYIPLRKEAELLEDYVVIQKFRYRDFTICNHIPESLMDYRIHKLMVVNLVENSIIHGIADIPEPGVITVTASLEEHKLSVTVADNGVGMSPAMIEAITSSTTHMSGNAETGANHTGLRNIQDRLQLYHGSRCSLSIQSTEGEGCSITITLPITTASSP